MKRQDYTVAHAGDMGGLIQQVKNYLEDGWRAQGGMCWGGGGYFQALVREKVSDTADSGGASS